jgi:hypothetical protein
VRAPADSPTPEETLAIKTGGCGRGARGYATTWDYRRIRQPLVIPRPRPEEEREPALLRRL